MFLEHPLHGLEVEFGGHIHDRQIFVIEFAVRGGTLAIALHQMLEHIHMGAEDRTISDA